MNKIFYLIIFVASLYGCSNKILYNKIYYAKKNPSVFIFSNDSTFKYEYRQSCYTESSGTWKQLGNALYLNSNIQDSLTMSYSKEQNISDTTVLNVIINHPKSSDYICMPMVNADLKYFFDMPRGSYSIKVKEPIDSICFSVIKQPFELRGTGIYGCYEPIRTEQIKPNLSKGEKLTVTINIVDSLFGYRVFRNEKLEMKNGKIIFTRPLGCVP